MLEAVLARRDERARFLFGIPSDNGRSALRSLLDLAEYNTSILGLVQLFCVVSAEAASPTHPAHEHFKQRYEETCDSETLALDSLAAEGQLREEVVPANVARRIIAVWDGLQIQWLLTNRELDLVGMLKEHLDGLLIRPL